MESIKEYLLKKYSPNSLKPNLYNIKRYLNYIQNKAHKAQYNDIINYITYLRKNHDLKPQSLLQCLSAVKIYYHYLIAIGKRKDHPCSELQLKDQLDRQIKTDLLYSFETLEDFLTQFKAHDKAQYKQRNQIIITLLIYQGLTNLEIINLKTENINLENAQLTIKGSNHKKDRTLPLQANQILLLHQYLENQRKQLALLNKKKPTINYLILSKQGAQMHPHSICYTINKYRKGKPRISPKKIRQSLIANLLKSSNDTRIVQVFAGHNKASTTEKYKQTKLEILQKELSKYHPLK
jgi:site-specific recombinase XerD